MKLENGGRNRKEKKEQLHIGQNTEQVKIARIIYGTRSLAECMEQVIKLHMER